jgi:anti-sigma regulatory factor (Ser/Thr protein kinase)
VPRKEVVPKPGFSPSTHDAGFAISLPRTTAAAAHARRAVTSGFADVLGEESLDDVLLVVSELVTNALLHGQGDIKLRIFLDAQRVTGAVSDEGCAFTGGALAPDPARIGGHGLYIVGRLAERWGQDDAPTKVWFEISAHA